jgi:hypothetical protein
MITPAAFLEQSTLQKMCTLVSLVAFHSLVTLIKGELFLLKILKIHKKCGGRDLNPRIPAEQGPKPCAFSKLGNPRLLPLLLWSS